MFSIDPLCTALCGGDGSKSLSSFQLELLRLLSEASPDGKPVLGGGKRDGRQNEIAKDESGVHLAAMTFDTSTGTDILYYSLH